MSVHQLAGLLIGGFSPPIWASFWAVLLLLRGPMAVPRDRRRTIWLTSWCWGAVGCLITALIGRDLMATVGAVVSLVVALAIRWWRKDRRRVKALAGAKSRAVRDAMVARMPKPRTVPQGA